MNEVRLIDANVLKKCAIPCEIHNGALTDLCVPLYQIDNAPTVPLPDFKDGYKQAIIDGKTNFSRPQGEWISQDYDDLKISDYRCNQCGHYQDDITNFCPNCGADMHKPNCVTCDHFGKCDGCEKRDEE